jgi:pimeloyl-ACP methyl ester carboxylesterase
VIELGDVAHRDVDAGGLRMHVAEAGEGPPLLLLHGWPQDGRMWRFVLPALAREFRCIVPDLRGLGRTEAPRDGYAKQQLADDVLALLDALGLDRVRLAGHDWGAFVAQLLAAGAPQRVDRVLVLDVPPLWVRGYDPRQILGMAHVPVLASPLGERLAPTVADRILRLSRGIDDAAREAYLAMLREPPRRRASAQYYRTFLTSELPGALASPARRPEVPVKCVGGQGDPVVRWSPDVELVRGAGHFLPEDRPDAVIGHALAFFR